MMKAVLYNKKNPKDKFPYSDIEKPIPNKKEVLVQIYASSINAADCRLLQMGISPKKKIFGADISGVVESVGEDVRNFKPGDEVIADLSNYGFGGFAEFVAVPEMAIVLKPTEISFEEAAAFPLAGITALQALRDKGKIQSGQKVLIVGSSGGVGTFAVQLAKYFGATVTGVCSSKNIEQTKRLGAHRVIDYTKTDFTKENEVYDLIIGVNGNYSLFAYKKCLNQNGKLVLVGGNLSQIFKVIFLGKIMSLGSKKLISLFAKSNEKDLELIGKLARDKIIHPVIEKIYSLENTSEAMRYMQDGHASGKIVIRVK